MYNKRILDAIGFFFDFSPVILSPKEYSKIIHEINSLYYAKYQSRIFCMHRSLELRDRYCIYFFENHGYNDYNIYRKKYI